MKRDCLCFFCPFPSPWGLERWRLFDYVCAGQAGEVGATVCSQPRSEAGPGQAGFPAPLLPSSPAVASETVLRRG